jgi:hypothetical protein
MKMDCVSQKDSKYTRDRPKNTREHNVLVRYTELTSIANVLQCFLEYRTMNRVEKSGNSERFTVAASVR